MLFLEKGSEKQLSLAPVFLIDTVLDTGWVDFTLYQPRILKLPEVLGNGGLCSRYDFHQVSGKAARLRIQQLQNLQPGRVPQSLGKPGEFLVGIFRNRLLCEDFHYFCSCFIVKLR